MPIRLPLKDELLNAMKVAESSVEAAEYLGERFRQILVKSKMLDQCKDMMSKVDDFVQYVKFKLTSGIQPWAGELASSSDFKIMQANIADDVGKKLKSALEDLDNLHLDIAISDEANLLRGYSADGGALDSQSVHDLDKLFNSWLAENNIISKNSTLYEVNEQGEIQKNKQGNDIKASAERVKSLLSDTRNGFVTYLANKGIVLASQLHPYPNAQVEQQKQHEVKEAIQSVQDAQTPDMESESPQTGIGSGG